MGKLPPNTHNAMRTVTEGKPKRTLVLLIRRSQVRILLGVLDLRLFEIRCVPTVKWGTQILAPAILRAFRSKPVAQTEGAQRRRFSRRVYDESGLY